MGLRDRDVERLGAGARSQVAAFREAERLRKELLKPQAPDASKAPSKWKAKKVIIQGITFDSRAEGRRFLTLKARQDRGRISDLQCHVRYPLTVLGVTVAHIEPDFRYRDAEGSLVFEDVKGGEGGRATMTPVWRLKAKLFHAIYGQPIRIIGDDTDT
jgi:hypothetical protein